MEKLISGIVDFRRKLTPESRALFAALALGQKPDALFIACSDSRVVPNLFASTNPGDLFVIRNIGNLIPVYSPDLTENSVSAALEFSLFSLNVSNIIVCGHSECGAIQAMVAGVENQECSHLKCWLEHGASSLEKMSKEVCLNSTLSLENQISQLNVLQQIEHLKTYPFVLQAIQEKRLRLHGWWFDIAQADVYCFEPDLGKFMLIDDQEALLILERLKK